MYTIMCMIFNKINKYKLWGVLVLFVNYDKLFILNSRLLLYSAWFEVNRDQCTRVCRCDGDVTCVRHDLNRCSGWW